jgi:hypothetical protein
MLVLVALLGTAGRAAAAEGAEARGSAAEAGAEVGRPIKYASQLSANIANLERHVVRGTCEAQGIRQIARLLKRSDFEEMWAFLPRARGAPNCEWHEIGREERSDTDGSYVRVDMAYLDSLLRENSEIHIYHVHPLKYFECAAHADCPRSTAGETGSFDKRWITDLLFSMPSPSDVHFMMEVTSRFHRRQQDGGTIRHRLVTAYGLVDFGLTEKGLAKFNAERHSRSEGLYISWVLAAGLADERLERVLREHPGSVSAAVRRLAQSLNTEFLRVEYRPILPIAAAKRPGARRAAP